MPSFLRPTDYEAFICVYSHVLLSLSLSAPVSSLSSEVPVVGLSGSDLVAISGMNEKSRFGSKV